MSFVPTINTSRTRSRSGAISQTTSRDLYSSMAKILRYVRVVLSYVELHCVVIRCTALCYVLVNVVLCCLMLCCLVLSYRVLSQLILGCVALCVLCFVALCCLSLYCIVLRYVVPFFQRSTFVGSAWSFGFFIPATTANDLRLRRIFYPRFYPLHLFSQFNS